MIEATGKRKVLPDSSESEQDEEEDEIEHEDTENEGSESDEDDDSNEVAPEKKKRFKNFTKEQKKIIIKACSRNGKLPLRKDAG